MTRLTFVTVLMVLAAGGSGCAQEEAGFQHDADIFRLRHLVYYVEVIEEYHTVTGRYPLQGEENVPVWVFVAHEHQLQYTRPGPSYSHVRVPFSEWVATVEAGLGRTVDEYYDPEYVPVERPNFYTYVVTGDQYYMSVHVSERFPFANAHGPGFAKVEVTNMPNSDLGTISPSTLRSSAAFQAVLQRTPIRSGLMTQRDEQHRHATKSAPPAQREVVTVESPPQRR